MPASLFIYCSIRANSRGGGFCSHTCTSSPFTKLYGSLCMLSGIHYASCLNHWWWASTQEHNLQCSTRSSAYALRLKILNVRTHITLNPEKKTKQKNLIWISHHVDIRPDKSSKSQRSSEHILGCEPTPTPAYHTEDRSWSCILVDIDKKRTCKRLQSTVSTKRKERALKPHCKYRIITSLYMPRLHSTRKKKSKVQFARQGTYAAVLSNRK